MSRELKQILRMQRHGKVTKRAMIHQRTKEVLGGGTYGIVVLNEERCDMMGSP